MAMGQRQNLHRLIAGLAVQAERQAYNAPTDALRHKHRQVLRRLLVVLAGLI
jgi:hypothetical protein